jgi:hypothetical protein
VTNFGTRAILALPKMPERRLRVLLALETLPRRGGGWREVKTGKLAEHAGLSVNTAVRARGELVASGAVEYRRGNGHGHVSAYRIKVTNDAGYLHSPAKVPNNAGDLERYPDEARKGTQTRPVKVPTGYSPTSQNVSGQLEPSQLEPSQLSRAAPADVIRAVFPGATDDEIEIMIKDRTGKGARSPGAVLAHEARQGILRLPCDRGQGSRHSAACRDGNPGQCGADWCTCRCHTSPGAAPGPAADDDDSSGQPASPNGQRDERPGPGYGQCPDCGRWYRLSGYGWLIPHLVPGYQSYCPGRAPAEPVPCVRCRQTGIALAAQSGLCNKCGKAIRADATSAGSIEREHALWTR